MLALDPLIEFGIRGGIGILFGLAVAHKLREPSAFIGTVKAYLKDTPAAAGALPIAGTLVLAELAIVFLCLLPASAPLAGAAAMVAFLLYGAAIGLNIARGNLLLDCGCSWGSERQPATNALVVRNLVLAALAAVLLVPSSGRSLSALEIGSAVAAAAILLCLYTIANQLILNSERLREQSR